MSPEQIIEREQRWRPIAVISALVALSLYLVSLILISTSSVTAGDLLTDSLRIYDQHTGILVFSSIISGIAVLAIAPPLYFLYTSASARCPRMRKLFAPMTIIGPVLLAAYGLIGAFGQAQIASDFVSQSAGVGDIYSLAKSLVDDSAIFQLARSVYFPALLILIFTMIYVPLWSVRAGLMQRAAGTMGMAIGGIQVFLPPQIGLLILMIWFGYVALLISGRMPGGRPEAWDAGVAVPWDGARPEKPRDDVVEADAREIPGVADNPHHGRRERAKRRKRKRRQ